ncbi:MAG TPA: hypothetical protein VNI02_13225 [Blastocatellia bacterium]|jgi:hypothetical protein|nr:hypothetical protein [Blastocatellia bacterium]
MPKGRRGKKKEERAGGELDSQDMLMRITNAYIGEATEEQRRMIYECTFEILFQPPKADESEKPTDEGKA